MIKCRLKVLAWGENGSMPLSADNISASHREIVMEVFPEYAAVRLLGTRTRYEVSWRAIFDLAAEIRAQKERQPKLLA